MSGIMLMLNLVLFVVGARGQFQLSFGTPSPAPSNTFDPNCLDKIDTCWKMPESNCRAPYETWAREYCPNRCGYCVGPTTPAPACENKLTNCEAYEKSVCSSPDYASWAGENCRYYCRLCTAEQLKAKDSITTTIAPENCVDKVDCRQYGANACSKQFEAWSKDNCPNHCGYCTGLPTAPPVCQDKIPNCKAYNPDTCTNPDYTLWVDDNCKSYCGRCPGQTQAPPMLQGTNPMPMTYQQPTPPSPGKRAEPPAPKQRRQFEASHHHSGTDTKCFDSSDPNCAVAPEGKRILRKLKLKL